MPKFNMNPKKNPMPSQDPLVRNKNFDEVATGYTAETAIDGLALQSGVEGERYSVTLDGREVPAYTFSEGMAEGSRLVQDICVPRSDGSTLLIELESYVGAEETVGRALQEMLESMTFPGESQSGSSAPDNQYVQCPDCGQWYEAGNVYRNHVCPAKRQADDEEYVQCDICGEWFRAGNEFRNHICVTYPSEDNMAY